MRFWLIALLASACGAPGAATPAPATAPPAAAPPATLTPARIVAIGDLHGDLDASLAVLRLAGLADASGAWSGGPAWLVQTGDILDRGPDSRGVAALMRRLQREAEKAGGKVVPLMGNHEAMNLTGDWRYVSPDDLATYGGEEKRRAAYGPGGEDAAWLLGLDAVTRVGDTVFCHGGVDAAWAGIGIREMNDRVHAELARVVTGPTPARGLRAADLAAVLGPDGPLWNRSYLLAEEPTACPQLEAALARLGAARMVVGHTTQDSGRIARRCDGRLWGIDTGISAHYGSHLAALELRGSVVTPIYPDSVAAP